MLFGRIGWVELVLVLVLALIIFGPGKLPEVARALGKSLGEFKKATKEGTEDREDPDKGARC